MVLQSIGYLASILKEALINCRFERSEKSFFILVRIAHQILARFLPEFIPSQVEGVEMTDKSDPP
jgi:hypothetical protein